MMCVTSITADKLVLMMGFICQVWKSFVDWAKESFASQNNYTWGHCS